MIPFIILFIFFFLIQPVKAQETQLEEIVVTATRIEEKIEETTSDVIVIKREDIEKMNVQFVPDVLRKIPELTLRQNGGTGKLATVFLRGGKPTQTLVMIDGVKVKSTTTGDFDFSGISVDDIERIEIVKGPQSTLYGSEAMAGVINIITKKGKGKPKIDLSFESGSYGTYKTSMSVSGGNKNLDYRLTTSYFYTDGISAAKAGTERDGYKNASVSGKFGFRPSEKFELELTGRYYYDRSELDFGISTDGSTSTDDPNYIQRGNHYILSGKGKFYLANIWEQILTISTVKDILKSRDPDDLWGYRSSDITTGIDSINWQHNFYISDAFTFTGGMEFRKEKGKSIEIPTNKLRFDKSIDNKAFYLNNKLKLFNESLVLNAGLRYDDYETFGNKVTYRVGAMYNIKPLELRIKSNYGTGFRAPTFNELFWPNYGNPDLKPEKTVSWEVGIEKAFFDKNLVLNLTYFNQKYRDLISTWPVINIDKAEIQGIEVNATLRITDKVNIKGGYTYLDTEDKSTGQRLPFIPKDKLNLSAEFSTKDISVIADYTFVSKRYDKNAKRNLSSYSLVNLSSNYKATKDITLFVRIENLFDEDYEEVGNYGTPGFSIFGGMKISL